ncbi:MAG TPA: hypothetical protein PLT65_01360 [Bacilli bacterium]|nr:hypothetical protein [Bacilli bacterium]
MKKNKKINYMKLLKIITIILGIIFILELGYLIYAKIKVDKNTVYANATYSGITIEDGYIAVGESDFKNSKKNDYIKEGYRKAIITKYDSSGKIVFEKKYATGLNSKFNDVIEVSDGYIAVGNVEVNVDQNKNKTPEAIIVKYDKDVNLLWSKNYNNLGVNSFNAIIETAANTYLAVGQSIYETNIIGNHTTGGAIIVEYSQDGEEIRRANYDGPKTGLYNDVIEVSDGYIVVGKIKSATAIIAKYNKNLELKWRKLYGNSDDYGFRTITLLDEKTFVVGGSKVSETSTLQEMLILKYNTSGALLEERTYKSDEKNMARSIKYNSDNLIVIGNTSTAEEGDAIKSFIVVYDKDLNIKKEIKPVANNTLILSAGDQSNVFGYTTPKIDEAGIKGKDIYPIIINISDNLELNYLKLK